MNNKNIFAANLKHQMALHGKSRRDICEALGFNYYTVTDWVNGKKYPRMDKVEKLANYFGILKSDLIEEKSVQDRIEDEPVKMAQIHIEMIMDEDLPDLFEDFKKLTPEAKQMAKKIIHSLVDADA